MSDQLLEHYAGAVTPFEKSLLQVGVLLGAPKEQALLSALGARRKLSTKQLRALRTLLGSLASNPALKLLDQYGKALEKSPKALASALASGASVATAVTGSLPSTGNATLDGFGGRLQSVSKSSTVAAFDKRMRTLLQSPAGLKYLKRLPPLLAAGLIPAQTLATYTLPGKTAKAAGVPFNPNVSASTNAWLRAGLALAVADVQDETLKAINELVGIASKTGTLGANVESLDGLLDSVLGLAFTESGIAATGELGLAAYGGYELGETGAEAFADVWYSYHPLSLQIVPGANTVMTAGQPMLFVVDGFGINGAPYGAEPATVKMLPNGGPCPGGLCTTTVAGPDGVIVTMGDVTTSIPVTVVPGPIEGLFFSPADLDITLPPGEHSVLYQPLDGVDHWLNDISPVVIGTGVGEATLTVTDGVCIVDTCIVKTPEVHTVTATVGTVTKTTAITVEEIKISPTTLAEATAGQPYSAALSATGGEAPYTWAVTAGALPEGLGLDPSTGVISGTPSTAGASDFEVTVTDKNGAKATAQYSLTVKAEATLYCAAVCAVATAKGIGTVVWRPNYCWYEEANVFGIRLYGDWRVGSSVNGASQPSLDIGVGGGPSNTTITTSEAPNGDLYLNLPYATGDQLSFYVTYECIDFESIQLGGYGYRSSIGIGSSNTITIK